MGEGGGGGERGVQERKERKSIRFHFECFVNERIILRPMYDEMESNTKYLGTVYSELFQLYLT
jgi:hypothetical protein